MPAAPAAAACGDMTPVGGTKHSAHRQEHNTLPHAKTRGKHGSIQIASDPVS